ncbi:disulfide bond formation protein DsbB [Pullulanibacillus pueri]|uniref:DUF1453 domain-containing protein n=1 Tax=Pullulanibacillus pueri TaxID=1437324 RepID=A0A8J3EQP6_9BACL|nr:CcdC protein domain-containing protein [Pullulanibacillus pueri]MBM7683901.1 disulfide bond formation protein DsbB [Pullulanibacillus pueri]GGH87830.1 hypothetical protein GCM10007096_38750 [Pullulanibacillus pueri]
MHQYSTVLIIILIAFAIYRRIRRNIGWQPLSLTRLKIRMVLFVVIGLIFFAGSIMHPLSLISDVIGIAIGIGLAYYGIKHTRFETRGGQWFYQPNTWIGGVVTLLFLGRFLYRFYTMYEIGAFNNTQSTSLSSGNMDAFNLSGSSPWSTGLILIMFAYYIFYYIHLMRKEKDLEQPTTLKED